MANLNRANLITESATLFPDNNTQEISPADLRSWLADGTASFVTQKDKSTLENAIFEAKGTTLASAATVDLNTATGNYLQISGTATINSFGTCPAGARFILMFQGIATLTYNATSLIIPGLANKTTAAGDCCMIVSEGSGNWRIVGYFAISGGGGGGITALTGDVTASGTGSVAATIASGAVDIPMLSATGTPSATTFLRGDNTWQTPAGSSPTGYYGAFQDNTTQTAASINTAYAVKLNTTDLSNNVTVVNDGSGNPTRVTMANAGIYNIQFSLQLEKTGGSGNMITDIWIRKNGIDIPDTTGKVVLTGSANASPIVAAWNYLIDLSAGDYIQLMWSTNNTNVEIVAASAASPHPAIPSAILTVTQQSGIMAGTGITSINSLTGAAQTIATGTSGTDFAIVSSGTSHTLNLPDASDTARGLITTANQTLKGVKTFGNGASAGEIRLLEPSGSGTNSVGIKAQAMTPNYDITLPANAGTSGYVLQTDGSGLTSWVRNGGGSNASYFLDTTETSVTGTTAETINKTLLIPANTYSAQTAFKIITRIRKDNQGFNNTTIRFYIGTNPASISGTLIGTSAFGATGSFTGQIVERSLLVISATQTSYNNNGTLQTDVTSGLMSLANIDWTLSQYLIITTQSNNNAYSAFVRAIQIIPQ